MAWLDAERLADKTARLWELALRVGHRSQIRVGRRLRLSLGVRLRDLAGDPQEHTFGGSLVVQVESDQTQQHGNLSASSVHAEGGLQGLYRLDELVDRQVRFARLEIDARDQRRALPTTFLRGFLERNEGFARAPHGLLNLRPEQRRL